MSLSKKAVEDFKYMIDHVADREELEDGRQMIRDASDPTSSEKKDLQRHWYAKYKKAPEVRK
jgi:hypothetical protein